MRSSHMWREYYIRKQTIVKIMEGDVPRVVMVAYSQGPPSTPINHLGSC